MARQPTRAHNLVLGPTLRFVNRKFPRDIRATNHREDGISNIKTVEEIAMKKPNIMANLLVVADECNKASKAHARPLDHKGKGSKKKQEDREVDTIGHKDLDRFDQKFKCTFWRPTNAKKWCKIHRMIDLDLEECKIYQNHNKMDPEYPAKNAQVEQCRGEHRHAQDDDEEWFGDINMILSGSLVIASKAHGKKLKCKINLAQQLDPGRRLKWSEMEITFGPDNHLKIELTNRNLPLVAKIPINKFNVAKTLIDNVFVACQGYLLRCYPGSGRITTGWIELAILCGTRDNKH
jgi:hypothetical protein